MRNVFHSLGYRLAILLVSGMALCAKSNGQIITTIAGTGGYGFNGDGAATGATLTDPWGVAINAAGDVVIGDTYNHRIRLITASGVISTIAGTGTAGYGGDGGPATAAELNGPEGVAIDRRGNIYISDDGNNRIRKISPSGIITTIAGNGTAGASGDGGPATASTVSAPDGIEVDTIGNVYFPCIQYHCIRKIDTSGIISTVAGNHTAGSGGDGGPATAASLRSPYDITFDALGNLYFTDGVDYKVRKVNTAGIISTFAGNGTSGDSGDGGPATAAQVAFVVGIDADKFGNIYVMDNSNSKMRRIDINGVIHTHTGTGTAGYSGDGGPATAAAIRQPNAVTHDAAGNLYIADRTNNRIRRITSCYPNAGTISGTDSVCPSTTVTLIDTNTGGNWISSNTSLASVNPTTGIVTGVAAGSAAIMYVATNTCGSDTARYPFTVRSHASCAAGVGSSPLSPKGGLSLYPNPNQGSFTINLASPTTEQTFITITNILGQKVKEFTIGTNKETEVKLNVPAGVYFIVAVVNGERVTGKVVVE